MNQETYTRTYQDRVQKLFKRVNNIQSLSKEEKQEKLKDLEKILIELEQKVRQQKSLKDQKTKTFGEALEQLNEVVGME